MPINPLKTPAAIPSVIKPRIKIISIKLIYYVTIRIGGNIWQYLKEKDLAKVNLQREKKALEEELVDNFIIKILLLKSYLIFKHIT